MAMKVVHALDSDGPSPQTHPKSCPLCKGPMLKGEHTSICLVIEMEDGHKEQTSKNIEIQRTHTHCVKLHHL